VSSSSHPNPHVPPITSMRGYVDAINELRDLVPAESQNRMYDLLTAIVGYVEDKAHAKAVELVRAERLTDDTGASDDNAYNQAIGDAIRALTEGSAS
jgi:hypothetical protein